MTRAGALYPIDEGARFQCEAGAQGAELQALRVAATREFPYAADAFEPWSWLFATRNRFGVWDQIGSVAPLSAEELDAWLGQPGADWVTCAEHQLLYFTGIASWSEESRAALIAIFLARSDKYRLQRIAEQETVACEITVDSLDGIVGQSRAMRDVFTLLTRVAKRDVAVCILGESGTGKELIARALHNRSTRRHKPFTTINCAALPENLIESELFGCARGAFTGAERDRAGLIEVTNGGTLFLDEIGEMPLPAQAKLLRFLQDGEFRRVGDAAMRTADVRVVTATNRHLENALEHGKFREDLYYRIRGIEITLPPLRARDGDVALLASHFVAIERAKHRTGPSVISSEVRGAFATYHWPGNVRELQNTIRAAHALAADSRQLELEHLPDRVRAGKQRRAAGSYQDTVSRFRRELIEKSLAETHGNQNRAAAMLKMSRQALAYQIRELGILVTSTKPQRL